MSLSLFVLWKCKFYVCFLLNRLLKTLQSYLRFKDQCSELSVWAEILETGDSIFKSSVGVHVLLSSGATVLVGADDYFLTSPLRKGPSYSLTRVMLPEDRSWFPRKQIFALSFGRENGVVAHRPEHSFCQSFPSGRKEKKNFRVSIRSA